MPSAPIVGSEGPAPSLSGRGAFPAMAGIRRPPQVSGMKPAAAAQLIGRIIVGLMLLGVIATFTISPAILTEWKVHYQTTGGNFYEKLHPATYFAFLAFCLLLIHTGDPIGEINRTFSEAKLVLVYLFCWLCLLVQMLVLERPFTVIVDTFLLPVVLCLVIWRLSSSQRRPLVWHFTSRSCSTSSSATMNIFPATD
jgi:hypothetical protein